jgi:hypothetical protein
LCRAIADRSERRIRRERLAQKAAMAGLDRHLQRRDT